MRCVFCKTLTFGTEPVEHILPESLGNEVHVLRRGIVCGGCNNYFASKVEKPFLELASMTALRFHQLVPSKKGRVPAMKAILQPGNVVVEVVRDEATGGTSVCVPAGSINVLQNAKGGRLILLSSNLPKPDITISRFIAKVALEALAYRMQDNAGLLTEIVDKVELDPIRNHARYGRVPIWPVSIRRIYDESTVWKDDSLEGYQVVNEFDFLYTEGYELYFVLVIFGQEYVMNMGGPELDGWKRWLANNAEVSPLYHGRNVDGQRKL